MPLNKETKLDIKMTWIDYIAWNNPHAETAVWSSI